MKSRLKVNMWIDLALLVVTSLVSVTGFVVKVVLPSKHAMRHEGVMGWANQVCGLGRHAWGDIHLWLGVIWVGLLAVHLWLHAAMVKGYVAKHVGASLCASILWGTLWCLLAFAVIPWIYWLLAA